MQTIQVQAVVGEGYDGAYRARRKWPSTEPVTVEVLDQDDDPPDLEQEHIIDGVRKGTRKVPHPTRIGRKTFAAIKADSRLRILADRDTDTSLSEASLSKARSMAVAMAAENAELKVKVAGLEDEIRRLRSKDAPPPPPPEEVGGQPEVEIVDPELSEGTRIKRRHR